MYARRSIFVEKIENSFAAVAYPQSELIPFIHPSATKAEAGAKDENIHPDQGKRNISLWGGKTTSYNPCLSY